MMHSSALDTETPVSCGYERCGRKIERMGGGVMVVDVNVDVVRIVRIQ